MRSGGGVVQGVSWGGDLAQAPWGAADYNIGVVSDQFMPAGVSEVVVL